MQDREIKNKVYSALKAQKALAEDKQEAAFAQAMCNDEFRQLDGLERSLIVSESRKSAFGEDTKNEKEGLKKIAQLKAKVLAQLDIDLSVKYNCPKCNDSGFLADGQKCACYQNLYISFVKQASNVQNLPQFNFSDNRFAPETKYGKLYAKMQEFCDKFPNTRIKTMLFAGGAGSGKTSIIAATAHRLLQSGFSVFYLTAFEMNNVFLNYHTSNLQNRGSMMETLLECDLIVIDDLGTEPILKNITLEYIFNLINTRVTSGKHTIISTNLDSEALLLRYGDRTHSRLTDQKAATLITCGGDDLRKQNSANMFK